MARSSRRRWPELLCLFSLLGCTTRRGSGEPPAPSNRDDSILVAKTAVPDVARSEERAAPLEGAPSGRDATGDARDDGGLLLVDDPATLTALEANGASLGEMLGGTAGKASDNAALAKLPRYASLIQVLEADIGEIARSDPNAGVSVARSSHRLFDVRWLRSSSARFELVGLVNRLDRAGIIGGCGEVRLVYRLAYAVSASHGVIASRLPMTLSLELAARADASSAKASCRIAALRWFPPQAERKGTRLAEWLVSERGALFAAQRVPEAIRRVAVNLQSVRWPSTVRPDLGGHAEYVLRAFADDGAGRLVPAPLENTLEVARVQRGTPLFRKLVEWVTAAEHLPFIDGGTIVLPDELSAKRVVSVTPRGFSRRKNRPFSAILREADLVGLPLSSTRHAKSPAALLRRLDDLTCSGCHESRSVAGFHFLGVDREGTTSSNALAAPFSPHFVRDQRRRREVVEALRDDRTPSYARPLAERAAQGDSGYGAHCGLGDAGFADWTCDPGYRCDHFDAPDGDATVGICLPENGGSVGDPCEVGPMAQNADPLRDRVIRAHVTACSDGAACNTNAVGFPGGMCTPSCGALSSQGACGRIAILDAFNACLAERQSFETCIAEHSSPAGLRRCSPDEPCRDDYICAGSGVCIPPYFVFQMRVDGHPAPPAR